MCIPFDQFYEECGSACIELMANFVPDQFEIITNMIEEKVEYRHNIGRGKNSSIVASDVLFRMLTVHERGGN